MKRRLFIKDFVLAGLGASLVPMRVLGTNLWRQEKPLHIIGLGGGGVNALEFIHGQGLKAKFTAVTFPVRENLSPEIDFLLFEPPGLKYRELPDIGLIWEYDQREELSFPGSLKTLVKNETEATTVLIAGLGGHSGAYLFREMSLLMGKHQKDFLAIGSLPFQFEGPDRIQRAKETAMKLGSLPNFILIDPQKIQSGKGDKGFRAGFRELDKLIFSLLPRA